MTYVAKPARARTPGKPARAPDACQARRSCPHRSVRPGGRTRSDGPSSGVWLVHADQRGRRPVSHRQSDQPPTALARIHPGAWAADTFAAENLRPGRLPPPTLLARIVHERARMIARGEWGFGAVVRRAGERRCACKRSGRAPSARRDDRRWQVVPPGKAQRGDRGKGPGRTAPAEKNAHERCVHGPMGVETAGRGAGWAFFRDLMVYPG